MNYKESSLNLQPTQDLMNQAYKVSAVVMYFFVQNSQEEEEWQLMPFPLNIYYLTGGKYRH